MFALQQFAFLNSGGGAQGFPWTAATLASGTEGVAGIAYGANKFAILKTSSVETSPDAVTWTARGGASSQFQSFNMLRYEAGLFFAWGRGLDDNWRCSTSPDALTWTDRTVVTDGASGNGFAFASNGSNLFVAAGFSSSLYTSVNGTTWTKRTDPFGASAFWTGCSFGAGLFVMIRAGSSTTNCLYTSPDGVTWTARTVPEVSSLNCIHYANGMFVVGSSSASPTYRFITSTDGINWTGRTGPSDTMAAITYGDGLWVATASGGTNGRVATSPDGIAWTSRTATNTSVAWDRLTYGAGKFAASNQAPGANAVMWAP